MELAGNFLNIVAGSQRECDEKRSSYAPPCIETSGQIGKHLGKSLGRQVAISLRAASNSIERGRLLVNTPSSRGSLTSPQVCNRKRSAASTLGKVVTLFIKMIQANNVVSDKLIFEK